MLAPSEDSAKRSDALAHAWNWFDLHAKQRMQTVNFYIVLMAATLAGSGAAIKDQEYVFGGLLGSVLILVSGLSIAMDRRARVLVRIGEAALRREQKLLAEASGNRALELVAAADSSSAGTMTYGRIFHVLFVASAVVGAAIVIYCGTLAAGLWAMSEH